MAWSVEGTYIEACNCEAACPCIFLSPPTEGECKAVVGWHVDKGHHGDTSLDGLNAALIAYAPGNMKDGQWKVALYLDERGNDKQRTALQGIFSGADGRVPRQFGTADRPGTGCTACADHIRQERECPVPLRG